MKKLAIACMASALIAPLSASADTVLTVDLSVINQVTISSTAGVSAATISGFDVTGFYLADFFVGEQDPLGDSLLGPGNLTSFLNTSDGSPGLFSFAADDVGLNVWTYTNDPSSDFVAGTQAFAGSATWTLNPTAYASALAGATSGSVFFQADDLTDLPNATVIGEWSRTAAVPLPAGLPLLLGALGALGLATCRRKAA